MCSLTTDLPPKTNVLYTVSLNGNGLSSTTSHSAEPKKREDPVTLGRQQPSLAFSETHGQLVSAPERDVG